MAEWQTIDTAPYDKRVLLSNGDWTVCATLQKHPKEDGLYGWFVTDIVYLADQPTHWMPLPPPPGS